MFDLDGTLIDTMFSFADLAAEIMAARHGDIAEVARADYLRTSGVPFRQQLELIHPDHSQNDPASDEFEDRKRSICTRASIDDDTLRALWALRARGVHVVLSSNTAQHFVDELVARGDFEFDLAIGFDPDAGMAKGEPHVRRTVRHLGVARSSIVFVGDSLRDGELAAETGIRFVGRTGTFAAADFERRFDGVRTIDSIAELAPVIF